MLEFYLQNWQKHAIVLAMWPIRRLDQEQWIPPDLFEDLTIVEILTNIEYPRSKHNQLPLKSSPPRVNLLQERFREKSWKIGALCKLRVQNNTRELFTRIQMS